MLNEDPKNVDNRNLSKQLSTDFVEQDEPFLYDEPQLQKEFYDALNLNNNNNGGKSSGRRGLNFLECDNFEAELGEPADEFTTGSSSLAPKPPGVGGNFDDDRNGKRPTRDFEDVAKHQIMDIIGADSAAGRLMVVFYAYRLPDMKNFDQNKFLEYITYTLDQYVEQDYTIIYFHYGLKSYNKPSFRWLLNAYKVLDRKYKKNLKGLFLVHPTRFIRIVYTLFKPFLSAKFERKINYVNYLFELNGHLPGFTLNFQVPVEIVNHDALLRTSNNVKSQVTNNNANDRLKPTRQFGVTLNFILKNYPNEQNIPPIVEQLMEFLEQPGILVTQGLFRRSAVLSEIEKVRHKIDNGEKMDLLHDWNENHAHLAAVLLKTFLRNLPEPLMTFELFPEILKIQDIKHREQCTLKIKFIVDRLPKENRYLLTHLVQFLNKVMEKSDINLMNATNLAIVFGPNLAWAGDQPTSLAQLQHVNNFLYKLLTNSDQIFV